MKDVLREIRKRIFEVLPKRLITVGLIGMAMVLPATSFAAGVVKLEGSIGVANVTAGDTQYKHEVNASYDQVVKFQVFYHNTEPEDSGKVAENLRVKIGMPSAAGQTQVVTGTISADNASNTVQDQATVHLNRSDATLDYIPGSAVWKHNVGTNENPQIVEQVVSDQIVTSGQGLVLENEKPCFNFSATVTVLARVHVPSVSITKQVRKKGTTQAVTNLAVNAGDHVEYLLTAKNLGNQTLTNVTLRDALPSQLQFVPGTVKLYNGPNPNGAVINNDYLFKGGVNGGSVGPGATIFITFEAVVKPLDQLQCGNNVAKNIVVVDTDQTGEYNNNATVTVNKPCQPTVPPTTTPTELPKTGAGDVIGIFAATSIAGGLAHKFIWGRRFARG